MGEGRNNIIDEAAERRWQKARHSYGYYQAYIESKPDTYRLGLLDLLYVGNFKGGQATTSEPAGSLRRKLEVYTEALRSIHNDFGARTLRELNNGELGTLINQCDEFLGLTLVPGTHIDGVGASYASALLHFHFPDLLPILDSRVLVGAGIVPADADEQADAHHYPELLTYTHTRLAANQNMSLTELDRELFTDP